MPYRPGPKPTVREALTIEMRMCFAAAVGCLLVGGIAKWANAAWHLETHFPALLAVGGFYGIMGLARCWKLFRTSATDLPGQHVSTGH